MSITNPSPHFKGLGQRMTRAMDESLQGVKAEIWELERKFEVADDKTQVSYHEWLEELKWDWEALQEELSRMKEEGNQAPLNQQCLPHRPLWSRRIQVFLLDLACQGHLHGLHWKIFSLRGTRGFKWHHIKNPPSKGEADAPSMQEVDPEELQQQERVQWAQEWFYQKKPQPLSWPKYNRPKR